MIDFSPWTKIDFDIQYLLFVEICGYPAWCSEWLVHKFLCNLWSTEHSNQQKPTHLKHHEFAGGGSESVCMRQRFQVHIVNRFLSSSHSSFILNMLCECRFMRINLTHKHKNTKFSLSVWVLIFLFSLWKQQRDSRSVTGVGILKSFSKESKVKQW
jgi:hypothetical protein